MASESEKEAILDSLAEEGHTALEEPRRATRTSCSPRWTGVASECIYLIHWAPVPEQTV